MQRVFVENWTRRSVKNIGLRTTRGIITAADKLMWVKNIHSRFPPWFNSLPLQFQRTHFTCISSRPWYAVHASKYKHKRIHKQLMYFEGSDTLIFYVLTNKQIRHVLIVLLQCPWVCLVNTLWPILPRHIFIARDLLCKSFWPWFLPEASLPFPLMQMLPFHTNPRLEWTALSVSSPAKKKT